jgi:putative MATE family efflux protein
MRPARLSRIVWAVSLPIIFAEVSETIVHVTDTIFLARVGITELAAIGLADSIYEICIVLTIGLIEGIQIITARRYGERRDLAVGDTFNQGLVLLILVSAILTVALKIGSPFLAAQAVTSTAVGAAIDDFLQILAFSIVFNAVNLAYSALFVSLARTQVLIAATIILAVTNITLDYVLIFGNLGFPRLGIEGAAIGSLGAEIVTFLFLTWYVLRRIDIGRYGLFRLREWSGKLAKTMIRVSSPVALQAFIEAIRWFLFFLILERISEHALALSSILYACYAVFRISAEGFSETACSYVSRFIGRGKESKIGLLIQVSTSAAFLATAPFVLLGLLFPSLVLSVFTSDPTIIAGSVESLRLVSLAMLIIIPAEMWYVAVSGTGDTVAALVIECLLAATMLGSAYVAAFVIGTDLAGIWMSIPISALLCGLLSYAWMKSEKWKRLEI